MTARMNVINLVQLHLERFEISPSLCPLTRHALGIIERYGVVLASKTSSWLTNFPVVNYIELQ